MARMPILPDRAPVPVPVMGRGGPAGVSFLAPSAPVDPTGGMTLDALMLRQKMLAEQQAAQSQPNQQNSTIYGGLGTMLDRFNTSRAEATARGQETAGREQLAQTLAGVDPSTGVNQQQIGEVSKLDPDLALKLYDQAIEARKAAATEATRVAERGEDRGFAVADREDAQAAALGLASAKAENWVPIEAPPGAKEGQQWMKNTANGEVKAVGGGGTSVTINPPSAEVSAKLGLTEGFTDNYDAIIKSIDAGEMTGMNWLGSVQFGRGNGGTQYRNLLQGTEGLVRLMTGAGMPEGEARQKVKQYEPAVTDDAVTLRSKVEGLRQALGNVTTAVETRGQPQGDGTSPPAATTPPAAAAGGGVPTPKTDAEFNALPSGSTYIDPDDGKTYRKP